MLRGFSDSSLALDGLTFSQNYLFSWARAYFATFDRCPPKGGSAAVKAHVLSLRHPWTAQLLTAAICRQARSRLERLDEAMHGGQTVPQGEFSDSFCMCACVWLCCECLRFLGRYHLSSRSLRFVPIGAGELWNLWRGDTGCCLLRLMGPTLDTVAQCNDAACLRGLATVGALKLHLHHLASILSIFCYSSWSSKEQEQRKAKLTSRWQEFLHGRRWGPLWPNDGCVMCVFFSVAYETRTPDSIENMEKEITVWTWPNVALQIVENLHAPYFRHDQIDMTLRQLFGPFCHPTCNCKHSHSMALHLYGFIMNCNDSYGFELPAAWQVTRARRGSVGCDASEIRLGLRAEVNVQFVCLHLCHNYPTTSYCIPTASTVCDISCHSLAKTFAHLGDVRDKEQIGPFVPLNQWVEKWLREPWWDVFVLTTNALSRCKNVKLWHALNSIPCCRSIVFKV